MTLQSFVDENQPEPDLPQWEYEVAHHSVRVSMFAEAAPDPDPFGLQAWQTRCNELGADGWEMVSHQFLSGTLHVGVFKRRVAQA